MIKNHAVNPILAVVSPAVGLAFLLVITLLALLASAPLAAQVAGSSSAAASSTNTIKTSIGEWSGEAGIELRYFTDEALFPAQFNGFSASAYVLPEYYVDWNDRRDSLVFEPFLRIDQRDSRRSHADVRELYWRHVSDNWELKAGVSTVFWGVTESQHLVDIINQTDAVENLDGEDKLGQPMLMLRWVRDWGTLDGYLLPGFRERTFPGSKGRLFGLSVDRSAAMYESGAEQLHTDVALRWSHVIGDWDVGLSHFHGTSREPRFLPTGGLQGFNSPQSLVLIPVYEQINQTGIDVQATLGAWLWKFEAIFRSGQGKDFAASTAGFEYSFYSVFDTDMDIGVLMEYSFDSRADDMATDGLIAQAGPDNDVFVAARLGFNDIQDSALLAGCSLDMDSSASFCIVEGSRRLSDQWVVSLEARVFSSIANDHPFATVRQDDLLQLDLTYHF